MSKLNLISEVWNINSEFIMKFLSLQVSEEFEQAVGNMTPGVGQNVWLTFLAPPLSPVFVQFCSPEQSAAQMSRTVNPYICAAHYTVRWGYVLLMATIFKVF